MAGKSNTFESKDKKLSKKSVKVFKNKRKKKNMLKSKGAKVVPKGANSNPKMLTSAKIPENQEDISQNWKKLLQVLPKSNKSHARHKQKKMTKVNEKSIKLDTKPDIWFDDVDELLLHEGDKPEKNIGSDNMNKGKAEVSSEKGLVKLKSYSGLTKIIGMDCEMVGVGYSRDDSILARVSIVNHFGHCVYDKYVKPTEKVTDYRTAVSGIRKSDIENAEDFKNVQLEVSNILNGRLLVGHALKHDLKVLFLSHPRKMIRDTSKFKYFRKHFNGKTPSLKNLSSQFLGVKVQTGEHSSVQDAQAAIRLYTMYRKQWESDSKMNLIKQNSKKKKKKGQKIIDNVVAATKSGKKILESRPLKHMQMYVDSDED